MKRKLIGFGLVILGGMALRFSAPRAVDSFGDYWRGIYSGLEITRREYAKLEDFSEKSVCDAEERISVLEHSFRVKGARELQRFGDYSALSGLGIVGIFLGGYGLGKAFFGRKSRDD